jgi:hypothetical protein
MHAPLDHALALKAEGICKNGANMTDDFGPSRAI